MRLTVTTFVTMDGVMQSPGAPQEDPRGGFDLGGWLPPLFDEDTGQYMNEVFDKADAILLGRRTYEAMAGFWPSVTDPANRVGVALNSLPKHVVTSTLTELSWANSVPVRGDIAQHVAELKKAPGRELQVHGSAALVHFLQGHGLVDGYNLVIFPVVLGRGTRLFADGTPPATMRLTGTRSTGQRRGHAQLRDRRARWPSARSTPTRSAAPRRDPPKASAEDTARHIPRGHDVLVVAPARPPRAGCTGRRRRPPTARPAPAGTEAAAAGQRKGAP